MPLWSLSMHGGPEVFGFERLNSGYIGAQATGMVATITEADLDFIRPAERDPQISFIAGYRDDSAGSPHSQFTEWRNSAIQCGGVVAIAGPREMPSTVGASSGNNALAWEALHDSWGAIVSLGGDCLLESIEARKNAQSGERAPFEESIALSHEQAEYAETLKRKMENLESFKVHVNFSLEDLMDRDSILRWVTNMWPVPAPDAPPHLRTCPLQQ
jgi:hypothetical protein